MSNVTINLEGIPTLADLPSNLVLFPTDVPADLAGYFKMVLTISDPDYPEPAVDISTGAITTTDQLIAKLVTSPGVLTGNPGIINITTIGNIKRDSGTGLADFYFQVFHRDGAGVETLIATSNNTTPIDTLTYEQFSAIALLNNGDFAVDDRIVIYYYANRIAGGSDPVYSFQFGGASPVRTYFPVPAANLLNVPLVDQVTEYLDGTDTHVVMIENGKVKSVAPTIQIDSVLISAVDWVLSAGIYKYAYFDAQITDMKVVEIIPANDAYSIVQGIEVLPLTESFNGYVEFYANNLPTEDFYVTILIRI